MKTQKRFIEIEIQVQIENSKELLAFLENNARFVDKNRQVDHYYTPSHRDFLKVRPVREWLRLRNSSGKYSINYKNWYYDENGRSLYCDEYETSVGDVKQAKMILKAIDAKYLTTVDKLRETWLYKDYEVAIDLIKNLGSFVEIEYKGKNQKQKPAKITQEMILFLKKLNCGKVTRNYVGYPFQLLFPNEIKLEEF